jgi:hypothetical protein
MAQIVSTANRVAPVFGALADIRSGIAAAAITAGQALYMDSNGRMALATAAAAGTTQFKGIALTSVGAGQALDYIARGHVQGFTISQAYDAIAYVGNTAGTVDDAAGTVSAPIGRVEAIATANGIEKVLFVEAQYGAKFA